MFGNLSTFGSLLDELRRWDSDWNDRFARSPWGTSIRAVDYGTYPPLNVGSSHDSVDVYLFAAGIDRSPSTSRCSRTC
jgi:HSP20 family protein